MPFNVSRAFDETSGIAHPRIGTAARDLAMWQALEQGQPMKSAEARCMRFTPPRFAAFAPPLAQGHAAVVIAGGGLVGLTAALDLARHGVRVGLLDDRTPSAPAAVPAVSPSARWSSLVGWGWVRASWKRP